MYTSDFLQSFPGAAYQTFPDSKNTNKKIPPQKGSMLDITEEKLQKLNKAGHGIFFSPNAMQRGYRDKKHCKSVNSFFVDMDSGKKQDQYKRIIKSPIHPSYIVESKNGYHIYFLVEDANIENFKHIQVALIEHYQGDIQCKDVSRVLRLPDFYHLKNIKDPYKITILESNPNITYKEDEIVELFNVSFESKKKKAPEEYTKHSAPKTFWEYVANIDVKWALQKLSGTNYVNNETFEFPERNQGGYYIVVNGEMANAWIDEKGMIGSGAGGGPTIIQWLKYYGYSYSKIANIVRAELKEEIPDIVLEGEVVDIGSGDSDRNIQLKIKSADDIRNLQELSDTFIASHGDNLFFCPDDNMIYIYDEEKKYHKGLTVTEADEYINNYLIDVIEWGKNVTSNICNEVYRQIKHRARRIEYIDVPYISLINGLLNVNTLEIEPHDRDKFCTIHIDLTYEELKNTETPRWDQFVNEIMVFENNIYKTDFDLKKKYMQCLGYLFSPVQKPHAFIFFLGEDGRNGKGTVADLLKKIIGKKYVSSLSLDELSNKAHASYGLVGKKINICGEDESVYIKNDILKTLASNDSINVNPKFKQNFSYVPKAKFLLMSNQFPRFKKVDKPMKRRIQVIPHNRSFKPHEMDWELDKKLERELPGIIWSIAKAYKDLRDNNFIFHKSSQSNKAMIKLESEVSATMDWFLKNYEVDESKRDENFYCTDDLYRIFKIWCEDVGRKSVSKNRWSRELSQKFNLESDVKWLDGRSRRGYYVSKLGVDK